MTNNHGKISVKGIIILLSLFLVAILFIVLGILFSYRSNPEKILNESLHSLSDNILNIVNRENSLELNDNYTIDSHIKTTSKIDETNEDIKEYLELLKILPKLDTNIKISEDKDNSKLFYNINVTKDNNKYIDIKYLVKDSTGYYYNDKVTNKYINVGTNNYFETLQNNNTTKENKHYLNTFIIDSIAKNISKEYTKSTEEKTTINNKEIYTNKLTIELDNIKANDIYKKVIKDLKKDKKASFILENYFNGFKNKKIRNKKFLDKKETVKIDIYTTGLTNKLVKVIITDKTEKEEKVIEYNKINDEKSILSKSINNKTKYELNIHKINNKEYNVDIYNDKNKNIGKITIKKTDKESIINISIDDNNKRLNLDYKANYQDIKNNTYRENIKLNVKYFVKNKNIITQTIEIKNKIDNKTKINEDTSESILENSLNEEQVKIKDQYIENKLKEILGGLYEKKDK